MDRRCHVSRKVQMWDTATNQQTTLTDLRREATRTSAAESSPDGTWLATTGSDGTVRIRDAVAGAAVAMMRVEESAATCAWSPRGHVLAVGGSAGLCLFEFQSGSTP
jgi:WD40 repeat protein